MTMNALILGGSGGIGSAFVSYLLNTYDDITIHASYFRSQPGIQDTRCIWHQVDVSDESSIENLSQQLDEIDLCIIAVGMLHNAEHSPEKSTRNINSDYFMASMAINALPSLLLAKHLASHFKHKRPAVFATVSARVGSIEENYLGGWYSYRASKAALNMVLKTLAIEWKRCLPNVSIAALHPGTTDTHLSAPFQKNVAANQLFSPGKSVAYMMKVINQLTPEHSGKFWSFDGKSLPW